MALGLIGLSPSVGIVIGYADHSRDVRHAQSFCDSLIRPLELIHDQTGRFPPAIDELLPLSADLPHLLRHYRAHGLAFYDSFGASFRFSVSDTEWWHDSPGWSTVDLDL
jgi:hypothetical protein